MEMEEIDTRARCQLGKRIAGIARRGEDDIDTFFRQGSSQKALVRIAFAPIGGEGNGEASIGAHAGRLSAAADAVAARTLEVRQASHLALAGKISAMEKQGKRLDKARPSGPHREKEAHANF
jgi:hypothetical protein